MILKMSFERDLISSDGTELLLYFSGRSVFSNFYGAPFVIDGQRYATVEQYYQAQKAKEFGDFETHLAILRSRSPKTCKALGYKVKNFNMDNWKKISEQVMQKGALEKFLQNPELRDRLMATGKKTLVEASKFDSWWGSGLELSDDAHTTGWPGKNKMGNLLCCVRECLKCVDK